MRVLFHNVHTEEMMAIWKSSFLFMKKKFSPRNISATFQEMTGVAFSYWEKKKTFIDK